MLKAEKMGKHEAMSNFDLYQSMMVKWLGQGISKIAGHLECSSMQHKKKPNSDYKRKVSKHTMHGELLNIRAAKQQTQSSQVKFIHTAHFLNICSVFFKLKTTLKGAHADLCSLPNVSTVCMWVLELDIGTIKEAGLMWWMSFCFVFPWCGWLGAYKIYSRERRWGTRGK